MIVNATRRQGSEEASQKERKQSLSADRQYQIRTEFYQQAIKASFLPFRLLNIEKY